MFAFVGLIALLHGWGMLVDWNACEDCTSGARRPASSSAARSRSAPRVPDAP
jgi:hypothetical protein